MELLAPGGDLDGIKAAILAGADAIYCGLDKFNARHRAANITLEDLGGVLALAHRHNCRVFLTLNIMMVESDLPVLVGLLNRLVNTTLDGVIVQDLGLLHLLSTRFPGLEVHASTQLTTHNEGQIRFLRQLSARRVNLSRELNLEEIRSLARAGHEAGLSIEAFVHGSYCLSFSGICYMSAVQGGRSGNRGCCSQPCREQFLSTPMGKDYPLNLKDNRAYFDLERLAEAGVDALKIEGRMKPFHYVYAVTSAYSRRLRHLSSHPGSCPDTHPGSHPDSHPGDSHPGEPADESDELYKVFNRGFSNAFLTGEFGRQMFADHPRNNSAAHLRQVDPGARDGRRSPPELEPYDVIADFKAEVGERIERVHLSRVPLSLSFSGAAGTPLKVAVHGPDTSFEVTSMACLAPRHDDSTAPPLSQETLLTRLKSINGTEFKIDRLELGELQPDLYLPQGDLTFIKKRILFTLNGGREPQDPVGVPTFACRDAAVARPRLAVLIDAEAELPLCGETSADIHFQLPGALEGRGPALEDLLARHERLIPWFPAVLIGEDYAAAVRLLHQARPGRIVTNNTGVAYEAWKAGIPWIAGPQLNTANSLSMVSLKENFSCAGAFVSNELSRLQIKRISPPEDFELHYSIYHPIALLTSRQCLFHQVTGCEKDTVDEACLDQCERSAIITNRQGFPLFINKSSGNYCSIYHHANFLNTRLVADLPGLFSSLLVDLRGVTTETAVVLDRAPLLRLFEELLGGAPGASGELERSIFPTTDTLYRKGI